MITKTNDGWYSVTGWSAYGLLLVWTIVSVGVGYSLGVW